MSLALLWTDKCFLLLLIVIVGLFLKGFSLTQTRLAYLRIASRPIAMSAASVLLFFLMVGIFDSIHFEPDGRSLLDNMLAPIGDVYEKTYSRPLALYSYSSEVAMEKGRVQLTYPRLTYINPDLKDHAQVVKLIQHTLFKSLMVSVGVVMLLFFAGMLATQFGPMPQCRARTLDCLVYGFQRRRGTHFSRSFYALLFTLFCCCTIAFACYWLSRDLHVLGTGKIGQDIFYASVKSIRTGLLIGMLTTLFMMPLALLLGISAGYFGGIVDDVIQYLYTTLSSVPGVLLITASVLSLQTYITNHPEQFPTLEDSADARLLALCLILGVTSWTSLCRLLRAEAMKLKEIDYVMAAKALGSGPFKIIFKHLLPNVMHIVIITFVLDFSFLVLAEAVLSYVGVGVSPLTMSWGNMINAARLELARDPVVWWPMMAAFVLMFTLVLASNLFADAVEDAFNPRHRDTD
jgi:peptide/nickel transport system permease protein